MYVKCIQGHYESNESEFSNMLIKLKLRLTFADDVRCLMAEA